MKPQKQQFLHNNNDFNIVDEPITYKLCVIRDYDKSLDKVWHVEYYIFDTITEKIKRRRVTLSQDTAKKRYAFAKEVIADIDPLLKKGYVLNPRNPIQETTPDKITIKSKIIEACEYFKQYSKTIVKPRTYEVYCTDIKRFTDFIAKKELEKLTLEKFTAMHAQDFFDYLKITVKISNRSANNNRNTLTTVFNFFKKRKIITANPFQDVTQLPEISKRHKAFTDKQALAFKTECIRQEEHQLLLFISFIYYCYLRPRYELRLLKIEDIKEKTIRVPAENAKDRTAEHVMIPPPLEKLIQQHKLRSYPDRCYVFSSDEKPGDKPLDRKTFYNRHRKILEKLKLMGQNLDTYSWKHTGVIALFQATQNIELVRQQCRHSDIATTQKYLRDLGQFVDYDQINKFPEL